MLRPPTVISLVPLHELASSQSTLKESLDCHFQGFVLSPPTYNTINNLCTITLVSPKPNRALAVIGLKGGAGLLIQELVREKDKVCLSCKDMKVNDMGSVKDGQLPSVGITFEQGVSGWIQRKGEKDEYFSFISNKEVSQPNKFVASSEEAPQNSLPTPPRERHSPIHTPRPISHHSPPESPTKRKRPDESKAQPSPLESAQTRPSKRSSISTSADLSNRRNSHSFQAPPPPPPPPIVAAQCENRRHTWNFANGETTATTSQAPAPSKPLKPMTQLLNPRIFNSQATQDVKPTQKVVYTPLAKIKAGELCNESRNFAVVIVGVGKRTPPRAGIPNDPWCARFEATDLSLCSENESIKSDSLDSVVGIQWYEKDPNKIPCFKPKDVVLIRTINVTSHLDPQIRVLRRLGKSPYPPYCAIDSATLLNPQLEASQLGFRHTNPRLRLTEPELDLMRQLARAYEGKEFPEPGTLGALRKRV